MHALSVRYGQRHTSELDAAARVAKAQGVVAHKTVDVDLRSIGGSALTDDIDVPEAGGAGIPVTYVPARNTIMLSLALGWAEVLGANDIFCGVNAVDYSGYPDCRPEFVAAFQALANLATKSGRGRCGHQGTRAAAVPQQGPDRQRRRAPGRGLRPDRVLLQRRRQRRRLRPL